MIDTKHQSSLEASCARIHKTAGIGDAEKSMLEAAAHAMADVFPDQRFGTIVEPKVSPGLLDIFCAGARHWWARLNSDHSPTDPDFLHHAMYVCPFTDAQIIGLVMRYERSGNQIWTPAPTPAKVNA